MSEAQRRYQRFIVSAGALKRQRVRAASIMGKLKGWKDCKVQDISQAGALVLASSIFDMGDAVQVELLPSDDEAIIFDGEVVNLGREHATGQYRLGIRLNTPQPGSAEMRFLDTLSERFRPCP